MFDESTLDQLSTRIAEKLSRAIPQHVAPWPEIMTYKTAALYMDRTPEAIKALVKAGVLPATNIDNRTQIRRLDIDRLAAQKTF